MVFFLKGVCYDKIRLHLLLFNYPNSTTKQTGVRLMIYPIDQKATRHPLIVSFLNALQQEKVYLLPLRLFIGIGWLRAGVEKWLEPTWLNGTKLSAFLTSHISEGQVAFPFYETLVLNIFEPSALTLSYLIMIGQVLLGIALISGTFTNLALLAGIFMNINFILIGEIEPSAFYIIIQLVLLLSHSGYTLGLDALLAKKIPLPFLVAQPPEKAYSRFEQNVLRAIILSLLGTAFIVTPQVENFGPSSVHDPVMIILILSLFATAFLLISLVQSSLSPNYKSPNYKES